jgi:hypothetical protein
MISEEESLKIFDDWADQQLTFINNRVVELQERLHKNGYSVQNLTLEDYEDCS